MPLGPWQRTQRSWKTFSPTAIETSVPVEGFALVEDAGACVFVVTACWDISPPPQPQSPATTRARERARKVAVYARVFITQYLHEEKPMARHCAAIRENRGA